MAGGDDVTIELERYRGAQAGRHPSSQCVSGFVMDGGGRLIPAEADMDGLHGVSRQKSAPFRTIRCVQMGSETLCETPCTLTCQA
jgi:hypothetical protein